MAGILAGVLLLCGGVVAVGIIVVQRSGVLDETDDAAGPGGENPNTGPVQWLWRQQDVPRLDSLWAQLGDDFTVANGAEVDLELMPREAYAPALASRIAAGDPPDLFLSAGGDQLREQVEQGLVRDLTDDLADVIATLPPAALSPYTVDGRVYGLPYRTGVVGVWYNRALFADAGLDPDRPPETWGEFLAAVEALKDARITPVAIAGVDNWAVLFWYGCLATRVAGVDAFVAAGEQRSLSENPDFLHAMELLDEFIGGEPFQPAHQGTPYAGPGGSAELMGDGHAAMELMGEWAPGVYNTGSSGGLGDDLGWFPFPAVEGGRGPGDLYGASIGFVVGADAPDATLDFLRFLFDDANYARILEADPGMTSILTDADPPADPNAARQMEAIRSARAMQLYLDADVPPEVTDELFTSMLQLLARDTTPEDAIARITNRWQEVPD